MGMTMTQKILARAAGVERCRAGELLMCKLDLVLGNDITAPVAINEFHRMGAVKVFDPAKIALIPDHFVPNKDIKAATLAKQMREFARAQHIVHYYEVGRVGIEHALLPEQGIVAPGEVIIGADSHTCTYGAVGAFSTGVGSTDMAVGMATGECWFKVPEAVKVVLTGKMKPWVSGKDVILHLIGEIGVDGALYQSLEFTGDGVKEIPMDGRLTIANMAIEAGAKNGIFPVDDVCREYLKGRVTREWTAFEADPDAEYSRTVTINLDELELHQRPHQRYARRRADSQGAQGQRPRALHRHPRHPAGRQGLPEGGAGGYLHRRGRDFHHADLRPVSGRLLRRSGRRRARRFHHQLCWPHGSHRQRNHSGQPGGRRGFRHHGPRRHA